MARPVNSIRHFNARSRDRGHPVSESRLGRNERRIRTPTDALRPAGTGNRILRPAGKAQASPTSRALYKPSSASRSAWASSRLRSTRRTDQIDIS